MKSTAETVAKIILRASSSKEFRYGLINRPPSVGAVPKGFVSHDESNQGIDGVRHGVITYDRALSDSEIKQYELLPLCGKDGKPLEVPKFPAAVIRKAEEAISTLNYVKDEKLDAEDDDIKGEIKKAQDVLKIFRSYAKSKHLDADAALEELGYKE